jgi:hypothetical protein
MVVKRRDAISLYQRGMGPYKAWEHGDSAESDSEDDGSEVPNLGAESQNLGSGVTGHDLSPFCRSPPLIVRRER